MTNELRLTTELAPSINHCYYTARNGMRLLKKDAKEWIDRTKAIAAKAAKSALVGAMKDEVGLG